ncbi:hypothetical protein KIK06_19965 [Nocardiopsis sp. EMB25]|uniref:hypothetical protein n=1 Tax=Nocardiopsis sp. EMB25 TaxID=2835867 RepID=UPI0022836390|nr:hypothetical protein [Nocardiopsis sp. EMB25]MCY9786173.1 hypothetical protein [Nocardiopsis sp. EMB25]
MPDPFQASPPPRPAFAAPPPRRGRAAPTWLVASGAVVVLLTAAGGGFALGGVRAAADLSASAEAARESRAGGAPAVVDGAEEDAEAEAADGFAEPGGVFPDGSTVDVEGVSFGLPAGWAPLESLPEDMSLRMDGSETAYALTRADGTIVAYVSVTTLSVTGAGGQTTTSVDAAIMVRRAYSPFVEGSEDREDGAHEVPGSPDTSRLDMRFTTGLDLSMLIVDTGAPAFAVVSVVVDEGSAPTEDEVTTADLEAILASVSVL